MDNNDKFLPPSPLDAAVIGGIPQPNWQRAKVVGVAAARLEPEAMEILPLLCQSSGQQGQALALPYAINVITRTAQRIVSRSRMEREKEEENERQYQEGRREGRREVWGLRRDISSDISDMEEGDEIKKEYVEDAVIYKH